MTSRAIKIKVNDKRAGSKKAASKSKSARGGRRSVKVRTSGTSSRTTSDQQQDRPDGWHPEQALVSTIITSRNAGVPIERGVQRTWFHAYQSEWDYIERFYERHKKPPSKTAFSRRYPDFEFVDEEDIGPIIDEVRESHARHSLLVAVGEITEGIKKQEDPVKIMAKAEKSLVTLHGETSGFSNSADVVEDWETTYKEVARRVERTSSHGRSGIPTGYPTLDKATGGFGEGEYWVVAARLKQGKTWTMIHMAVNALIAGHTVLYFALEGSKSSIHMRAHNLLSAYYSNTVFRSIDLMRGSGFDLLEYKKFLRSLSKNLEGRLIVDDTPRSRLNPLSMAAMIEKNQPRIWFLDYIQLMAEGGGDWQAVTQLSGQMQDLTNRYRTPGVVASQINRTGGFGDQPPDAEHLAGADAIGRDVDGLVTMKQRSRRMSLMKLANYRHGPDGQKWWAMRDLDTGRIAEVDGQVAGDIMDEDKDREDNRVANKNG